MTKNLSNSSTFLNSFNKDIYKLIGQKHNKQLEAKENSNLQNINTSNVKYPQTYKNY